MKTRHTKKATVFVGLSGGVDSAVSAALLKDQGYNVAGVFMKTWHPEFLPCTWREDRMEAMRVAAHLEIPFLTFDLEDAYKQGVAEYMIREYAAGRTPNPDVMCNKEVKFGAFLARARAAGADYVATGHYARNTADRKTGAMRLFEGADPAKDQSYFLWTLGQEELRHALFPLGGMQKSEVRMLARTFGLPNAERKDSQGVCFIGALDMKSFLKRFIATKPGDIVNEGGEVVGIHEGAQLYTLGERHGFTITKKTPHDEPYYVVAKDVARNVLTVAHGPAPAGSAAQVAVSLQMVHWVGVASDENEALEARIRYHGERFAVTVESLGDEGVVYFKTPQLVAPGQSIVFYRGTECLGGGVVRSVG